MYISAFKLHIFSKKNYRSWGVGLNVAGITVTGSTQHKVNNKQRESN